VQHLVIFLRAVIYNVAETRKEGSANLLVLQVLEPQSICLNSKRQEILDISMQRSLCRIEGHHEWSRVAGKEKNGGTSS
jgi:hypothetical protein